MRLSSITEAKDKHAIQHTSQNISTIKDYIISTKDNKLIKQLYNILKNPDPQTWQNNKSLLQDLQTHIEQNKTINPTFKQELDNAINAIAKSTNAVFVASLYSMPKKELKGTPLSPMGFSDSETQKIKKTLGPQGYVATLASASDIPQNTLKKTMKDIAKNSNQTSKEISSQIPGTSTIKDF
jgi:predicted component of type VI protein secretion system